MSSWENNDIIYLVSGENFCFIELIFGKLYIVSKLVNEDRLKMIDVKKYRVRLITDKKGKKTKVILKEKDFEKLIENLSDMAIIAERRDEEKITHEDLVKELKRDGIL